MSNNQLVPFSPYVADSLPPVITSGVKAEIVSDSVRRAVWCCCCRFVRKLNALHCDKSQMSGEQAVIRSLKECRGREGRTFTTASRTEWNNPGGSLPSTGWERWPQIRQHLQGGKEGQDKTLSTSQCCGHVCGKVHFQNKCLAFWLFFTTQQILGGGGIGPTDLLCWRRNYWINLNETALRNCTQGSYYQLAGDLLSNQSFKQRRWDDQR